MVLLGSGGFFRDCGLNSLPSIRHLGRVLNDPNIFTNFKVKTQTVASFARKSKFLEQTIFSQRYIDTNRAEEEVHSPIIIVEFYFNADPNAEIKQHAVVLKDSKLMG